MDIYIDLDRYTSGEDAIKKIQQIERAVDDGIDEFVERLELKLHEHLSDYGLGDSSLASKISSTRTLDGVSLSCDSDHFLFVEFGTGIKGAENPHPNPSKSEMSWEYNSWENGWWYPTTESDPNPYKKVIRGQLKAWTRGMPSRPFMYKTWLWGTRSIYNIIGKHIRRAMQSG